MSTAPLPATGQPVDFFDLHEHPHPEGHSTMLGFWIYLMSDCLIFAILFACFAVLGGNYAAGPAPKDLFDLNLIALNTAMLLFSSITYGFAMLAMMQNKLRQMQMWLVVTLLVQTSRHGLIQANKRRLMCLSLFWHFLDVIWIGVFTFVYLFGMLR